MSELNIKEFYEISGYAGHERATSILPRMWPIKKIDYAPISVQVNPAESA